jgi:hypothetical protein
MFMFTLRRRPIPPVAPGPPAPLVNPPLTTGARRRRPADVFDAAKHLRGVLVRFLEFQLHLRLHLETGGGVGVAPRFLPRRVAASKPLLLAPRLLLRAVVSYKAMSGWS